MALDDLGKKASDLYAQNKDKIDAALKSEQAEQISDNVLDGVAGFANKVTGNKFEDQVKGARDAADGAIGTK